MPTDAERLIKARSKVAELEAREAKRLAKERTKLARRQRSDELRRKILVGAIVLQKVASGEVDKAKLLSWLNEQLTREDDRELFAEWSRETAPESGT